MTTTRQISFYPPPQVVITSRQAVHVETVSASPTRQVCVVNSRLGHGNWCRREVNVVPEGRPGVGVMDGLVGAPMRQELDSATSLELEGQGRDGLPLGADRMWPRWGAVMREDGKRESFGCGPRVRYFCGEAEKCWDEQSPSLKLHEPNAYS
ncbi:unnamed protein product [Protopolystoma xenopodis]|uniref:Uncharacterized protein n=1 Tax=Protopolystoma xenopodis TaxID=117903 RepID=A0A3S5AKD8_9PLAT|nr:unnamed protein product [Protopolystoma xenopodis]